MKDGKAFLFAGMLITLTAGMFVLIGAPSYITNTHKLLIAVILLGVAMFSAYFMIKN